MLWLTEMNMTSQVLDPAMFSGLVSSLGTQAQPSSLNTPASIQVLLVPARSDRPPEERRAWREQVRSSRWIGATWSGLSSRKAECRLSPSPSLADSPSVLRQQKTGASPIVLLFLTHFHRHVPVLALQRYFSAAGHPYRRGTSLLVLLAVLIAVLSSQAQCQACLN